MSTSALTDRNPYHFKPITALEAFRKKWLTDLTARGHANPADTPKVPMVYGLRCAADSPPEGTVLEVGDETVEGVTFRRVLGLRQLGDARRQCAQIRSSRATWRIASDDLLGRVVEEVRDKVVEPIPYWTSSGQIWIEPPEDDD